MSKNKSPGPDGLSVEFYSKFWNLLGPFLLRLLIYATLILIYASR